MQNQPSASTETNMSYPIGRFKRLGYCLIINERKFDDPALPDRGSATDLDAAALSTTFGALGFRVRRYNSVDIHELNRIVQKCTDMYSYRYITRTLCSKLIEFRIDIWSDWRRLDDRNHYVSRDIVQTRAIAMKCTRLATCSCAASWRTATRMVSTWAATTRARGRGNRCEWSVC